MANYIGCLISANKISTQKMLTNNGDYAVYIGNKKRCRRIKKIIDIGDIFVKTNEGIIFIKKL